MRSRCWGVKVEGCEKLYALLHIYISFLVLGRLKRSEQFTAIMAPVQPSPPPPTPPPDQDQPPPPHVLIFPFMSKGHTIPLLHFARLILLHHLQATITIFTTPANKPFIADTLSDLTDSAAVTIIDLPFPDDIPGVPPGVESTDKLPSMSLFLPFVTSTKLLQPHFESAIEAALLDRRRCFAFLVSDGFLHWTLQSAEKFNVPRLAFYGMSNYVMSVSMVLGLGGLLTGPEPDDEPITVPEFPWIRVTRNDFPYPLSIRKPAGPHFEFIMESRQATAMSFGIVSNSFYELEPMMVDFCNQNSGPRSWCVGPLCWAEEQKRPPNLEVHCRPVYIDWLDEKRSQGREVLYIAFGTQAEISNEQLREITVALERSDVEFLWAVREKNEQTIEIIDVFEEKVVKGEKRGMVMRDWIDQRAILSHETVTGFLSHCGWNSVIESVYVGVPILAWPMMADQHLNARMVVEEIKVGLKVETCDGSVRGFVKWEGLTRTMREFMVGVKGKEAREKVKEISLAAKKAVEPGGSSWNSLESLLHDLHNECALKQAVE